MIGHVPKDGARVLSYVLLHDKDYELNVSNIHLSGGDEQREMVGLFFDFNISKVIG